MKKVITSKPLNLAIRVVIGGLFIYAGVLKLLDTVAFAQAVDGYGLVTWRMANLIANTLPVLEIISGLGLIFNIRGALGLVVAQLLGFMILLGYAIYMGLDVDCGCFGPSDTAGAEPDRPLSALIRDMLMFAACLFIYWQRRVAGIIPRSLFPLNFLRNKDTSQ